MLMVLILEYKVLRGVVRKLREPFSECVDVTERDSISTGDTSEERFDLLRLLLNLLLLLGEQACEIIQKL